MGRKSLAWFLIYNLRSIHSNVQFYHLQTPKIGKKRKENTPSFICFWPDKCGFLVCEMNSQKPSTSIQTFFVVRLLPPSFCRWVGVGQLWSDLNFTISFLTRCFTAPPTLCESTPPSSCARCDFFRSQLRKNLHLFVLMLKKRKENGAEGSKKKKMSRVAWKQTEGGRLWMCVLKGGGGGRLNFAV